MKDTSNISQAVIRRLPRYYRYVNELFKKNVTRISSRALAEEMGLTASQIRQDLNCFGGFGQQGYGYNVNNLRAQLGQIMGLDREKIAVMVGVGNLGHTLINNFSFAQCGFRLAAAFDVSAELIGQELNHVPVYHVNTLTAYVKQNRVDVAVLTLPKTAAESVVRELIEADIRGIWNFTGIDLQAREKTMIIENVHLSDSMMVLGYQL